MFLGREELWGVPTVRGKGRNTQTPNHPGRTRIPVLPPSGMKLEKVSVLWSHVSFYLKCSSTVNIVIWKYHQIHLTTLTIVPGPKSLTCVCGGGGFPRISRQRSGHQPGVSHFNSDTFYPEILSDFTGWGHSPIRLLPYPSSGTRHKPRLLPVLLTKRLQIEGSDDLPTPTQDVNHISKAVPCTSDQLATNQRFPQSPPLVWITC